jgi:hypothetical protein
MRAPGARRRRQPPGTQAGGGFEHEIPVQQRMIVFEKSITLVSKGAMSSEIRSGKAPGANL